MRSKEAGDSIDVGRIKGNLRVAAAGGSALPVEVHKEFEQKFGVTILEGYGLSETSPVASFSPEGDDIRVGSIGLPASRCGDEAGRPGQLGRGRARRRRDR